MEHSPKVNYAGKRRKQNAVYRLLPFWIENGRENKHKCWSVPQGMWEGDGRLPRRQGRGAIQERLDARQTRGREWEGDFSPYGVLIFEPCKDITYSKHGETQ